MSAGESFRRIATGIAVEPLLKAIAEAEPPLWRTTLRETYPGSAHAGAQSILVRGPRVPELAVALAHAAVGQASRLIDDIQGDTVAIDYPATGHLMPAIGDAVMSVLEHVRSPLGDLGRVMLTKLPAGASIARHTDEGVYADLYDRFHLALQSDAGCSFTCGPETYLPRAGDAFWFNHKRQHAVENRSSRDRIHLIVDVMAPAYRALRGVYYQEERVSGIWAELEPLLEAHWAEIARYQDIKLDPDVEAYERLEAEGKVRCYTARDGGALIGYAVFFVRGNLHYRNSLQAIQDVLFVLPQHRAGLAGVRLIKVAEERLKALGVQVVYHHAKRTNRVGELLERLGYELVDGLYAKRLDKKGT